MGEGDEYGYEWEGVVGELRMKVGVVDCYTARKGPNALDITERQN